MEITIRIPKLNRSAMICVFLVLAWTTVIKVAWDGHQYIQNGTHPVTMIATSKIENNRGTWDIEFTKDNKTISKRYTRTAGNMMEVGTAYTIQVQDEKTIYNCVAFLLCSVVYIVLGVCCFFGCVVLGISVIGWTADFYHGRNYRTIKQMWNDWS